MLSQFTSEPVDKMIVTLVSISVVRALPQSFLTQHGLRAHKDLRGPISSHEDL
jgi:hypothetical protein